jgi:hypothetical protein
MTRFAVLSVVLVLFAPSISVAQVLLDKTGEFGPEPTSSPVPFAFELQTSDSVPQLETKVELTQGKAMVRVTGPDGDVLFDGSGGSFRIMGKSLGTGGQAGTYQVEIVPERAVGSWTVRVSMGPAPTSLGFLAIPGLGMLAVGFAAVFGWRRWSQVQYRWFWVGAAVWTVGVALKFAWAVPLNTPILTAIGESCPRQAFLLIGSIYIGLLTGVFEIGVTLVAALFWRGMTRNSGRGIAVGVGAGAFEAVLLAVASLLAVVAALTLGGQIREQVLGAAGTHTTPLFWLVAPVERAIVIPCHTASRALVLLGVARGRWLWPFVGAFLLMTAIDSVAGYVHLAGLLGKISLWWIELALVPAALVSLPIGAWCIRNWPKSAEAPVEAASSVDS